MTTQVDNWNKILKEVEDKAINSSISFEDALSLTQIPDELISDLAKIANNVRQKYSQNKVDLCSIINARSGKCSENCKFCVQSAHHEADISTYPMKSVEEIVEAAKLAEKGGAHRFCIVTSGNQLNDHDFEIALKAIGQIKKQTNLKRCASLGKLTKQRAKRLKEAGISRFHHNLETAQSYFSEVCTTHTFEQRLKTINELKEEGIQTCVGGILNLGETPKQRIEFAFKLKELEVDSVPINFLNPRPGTPLENQEPINELEAIKYLAIFRLIMPKTYIRLAGGRQETFKDPSLPFNAGVNALLIGDLLTTQGPQAKSDLEMLKSEGFNIGNE